MADPSVTYRLDRGYRLLGPFFAGLILLSVWAFFTGESEPSNNTGGLLAVALFALFGLFGHAAWVRTRVVVDDAGIAVRDLFRERRAPWRDVTHAQFEASHLILYLVTGERLKVPEHIAHLRNLLEAIDSRGLLRTVSAPN
jgi:hypothetical protein